MFSKTELIFCIIWHVSALSALKMIIWAQIEFKKNPKLHPKDPI